VTAVRTDGGYRQNVLVGADGSYSMDVPRGLYRVIVDAPGAPRAMIDTVDTRTAASMASDLAIAVPGTLVGTVTDQEGPVQLPVQIVGEAGTYYTRTDATGAYEIDLPPGTYTVAPLGDGAGGGSREVEIAQGEVTDASAVLQPQSVDGTALRSRPQCRGDPIGAVRVRGHRRDDPRGDDHRVQLHPTHAVLGDP
jgi:hypothetical protein